LNAPAQNLFTQVQNNCLHFIHLPPTDDYPDGHRLIPGANNVATKYLESLKSFKVPARNPDGSRSKESLFDSLARASKASLGKPQVQVLGSIKEDAPEGPPPPFDLSEYKEELALMLIQHTSEKEALKRWSKDPRPDVATAATTKLRSR
jgi:hypothetical protein